MLRRAMSTVCATWSKGVSRRSSAWSFRRSASRPRCGCRKRSEEHTSELQSRFDLVCRLLLEQYRTHPHLPSFPTRRSSDLATRLRPCHGIAFQAPHEDRDTRNVTPRDVNRVRDVVEGSFQKVERMVVS